MKHKKFVYSLLLFSVLIHESCYYDKAELLYPNAAYCDTLAPSSYSQKVVPILGNNCYSCHSGSAPAGDVAMGTYAKDKVIGLNGRLYGSIRHAAGYSPMPKSGIKLSDCEISTVKRWIDASCPDN